MHVTTTSLLLAACAALALSAHPARAQGTIPEAGRWVTESGNLEVEIAPCGPDYCGTVTRVIADHAMGQSGTPMAASASASVLGKTILSGLQPLDGGGWLGRIVNRENGKTYHSRVAAIDADRLQLTIYEDTPADGRVQVWRRAP
jgi:uncharacterized protein (DUF2147 family)